ncbi:hypothetical protein [Hyalangium rubrum]|uniref:Lipoprotein n=1 Tax=Hyalangium rubrum TaxID=3103134 RepID=A0ABU5GVS3_9BACT|nr:hypothetical protein [Hyalangium sp. s54d21]MDY7225136.1 hypothetical protein [Hyalangium sp. s54d21]
MKRLLLLSALATCFLVPLACDLGKTVDQISAETVMVGTLLSTPDVPLSPEAAAGLDGGFQLDGGQSTVTIPGQTVAFLFLGTREDENSTPSGLTGATVSVQPKNGQAVSLSSDGAGAYSRSSNTDEKLTYQSGATYTFTAERSGERYVGVVENSPAQERIAALHPASGVVRISANTPLSFDRADPPSNQDRTIGFVTVVPVSASGQQGQPTYSNVPTAPLDFIKLVAFPAEWKEKTVSIPGTAFPDPQQTYLVTFQAVRTGGPESSNLFLGSAILTGTADVGVVRTQ